MSYYRGDSRRWDYQPVPVYSGYSSPTLGVYQEFDDFTKAIKQHQQFIKKLDDSKKIIEARLQMLQEASAEKLYQKPSKIDIGQKIDDTDL